MLKLSWGQVAALTSTLGSGVLVVLSIGALTGQSLVQDSREIGLWLSILFVWQPLAVTIAKHGLDQQFLAAARAGNLEDVFILDRAFHLRTASIALVAAMAALASDLGIYLAMTLLLTTIFDAPATIRTAEALGKKRYLDATIANILRLPLAFALLFLYLALSPMRSLAVVSAVFFLSSATRYTYLAMVNRERRQYAATLPPALAMASQQIANFSMFRVDQLVAPLVFTAPGPLAMFFFLSKFIEAMSIVAISVLNVTFRSSHDQLQSRTRFITGHSILLLVAVFVVTLIAAFAYSTLWHGAPIPWSIWFAAILGALLAWPANALTLDLLARQQTTMAFRYATLCALAVLVTAAVSHLASAPLSLYVWALPLGLALYTALTLIVKLNRHR